MTVYRKLLPTDLRAYRDHLLRLSSNDRYSRFCGFKTDESIAVHCQGIDWRFTIMVGCFVRGELRAVAELRTEPKVWPGEGELAVSVERDFQNQGLGSGVVRRILTVARNRAIRRLVLICLIGNRRMQAVVRKFLGKLDSEHGEVTGRIELPWPSQMSLLQEALDSGSAVVDGVLDQWRAGPSDPVSAVA
ncbi:GCN5 family acetyltransferase [Skermanella stibiiresistens SB22]|uniref:GCN5 family acetyltransferase n=1 Tax=Skermanella stibiiresistens SB22 TaxID=1385369 RepID=W9GYI6_9PROT|nr:GNAT family N-acetyltransferase [Skermanella stibiiresistens]EWY37512.1 GCN5 family acetyltransferase [Skermanella stibiiresistens SB22]